jgi:hypothetical protein
VRPTGAAMHEAGGAGRRPAKRRAPCDGRDGAGTWKAEPAERRFFIRRKRGSLAGQMMPHCVVTLRFVTCPWHGRGFSPPMRPPAHVAFAINIRGPRRIRKRTLENEAISMSSTHNHKHEACQRHHDIQQLVPVQIRSTSP